MQKIAQVKPGNGPQRND